MAACERVACVIGLIEATKRWAADQLATGRIPAQVDLDALMDGLPQGRFVEVGIQCAVALSAEVLAAGQSEQIVALVVFPIGPAPNLTLGTTSLSALEDEVWGPGPGMQVPGLYLLPRGLLGEYEAVEEYKSPVSDSVVPPGFAAYYRCWRSVEDAKNGWEYARAIYLVSVLGEMASPWENSHT